MPRFVVPSIDKVMTIKPQGPGGLTIVVPYRDRRTHLLEFIPYMEEFLAGDFRFLIVEQADRKAFNKGALLNIGFTLARGNTDWVAFHDIDLLPMDAECDYSEPETVRHLAGAVEQFGWTMPYSDHVGGVLVISPHIFEAVNGYSNNYWGWGCEDDDFFLRLWAHRIRIERRPGRYRSLQHPRAEPGSENRRILSSVLSSLKEPTSGCHHDVFKSDGLSSLTYHPLDTVPLHLAYDFHGRIGTSHQLIRVSLE